MPLVFPMSFCHAGSVPNTSTWNPADKNASVTLSNSNYTAASSASSQLARSVTSHATGKWYAEFNIDAVGTASLGIATSGMSLSSGYVGSTALGWGDYAGGQYLNTGSNNGAGTPPGYTSNDIIMVAFDADAGKLWLSLIHI